MREELHTLYYLVLTKIPGFGPARQNRLLELCGDIEHCFTAGEEELVLLAEKNAARQAGPDGADLQRGMLPISDEKLVRSFAGWRGDSGLFEQARAVMTEAGEKDIQMICRQDKAYPARFCGIAAMPVLLYVKGKLHINEFHRSVGIIGARRCSHGGRDKAIELTKAAAGEGTAVISGMAKGIDSYAHTAAVLENGYTVAVLGSGPDICYPREHRALYEAIIGRGCVLSEYPPGVMPRSYMFPCRNRLIAALSDELYVIEAGRNSGTRTTTAFCERYGRRIRIFPA